MFKSKAPSLPPDTDFTKNLREQSFYRFGSLRRVGLTGDITALAVDPLLSLFAVGTSSGVVHVFGQAAFQFTLPVSASPSAAPIKFLTFHPGHQRLIVVDESSTLHSFSLSHLSDHPNPLTHPPLPIREGSHSLWATVTAVEQPLPCHTHLFLTIKDGTTLAWDLSRRVLASWKVANQWGEYEQRMIRSGIPGRRRTNGAPMATCLAMHPRDLNIMLIGYEGGVAAWDFQKNAIARTFEMTLPPGAPGGGSYQDSDSLWTERTPTVTCIAWRPDGLVFAVGHSDGCITFWAYSEPDKPLMVRTITHEDVNVTDADALFSANALPNQIRTNTNGYSEHDIDGIPIMPITAMSANREPVFKLTWAGFPDQLSLRTMMAAQGADASSESLSDATIDYGERGETLLLVLGGQSPGEKPGINSLQFPAYQPALMPRSSTPTTPSESMPLHDRYAFRDSLMPTGSSYTPTATPPEDFVLLPRSSPYFGMAFDAVAMVVTLTPDPSLAPMQGLSAQREVVAWAFPPPRSTIIPPSPGRKAFKQPGEDEKLVAMTPAPSLGPMSPRTPSAGGWKLPWTSSANPSPLLSPEPSPAFRLSTPNSLSSAVGTSRKRVRHRQRLRMPSTLWSGSYAPLGCELCALSIPAFKRLISWSIEHSGDDAVPRLPIRGGMAVPDLQSQGAPDVKVAKLDSYRIFITHHPDASVRFWDASPHLLLLPTPLRFEFPGPLPHLTISLGDHLKHPDVAHLPLAKLWKTKKTQVRIKSVHLAREALEVAITMATGEVLVYKFGEAKKGAAQDEMEELQDDDDLSPRTDYFGSAAPLPSPSQSSKQEWIEEVTEIGHLAKFKEDSFRPVAIFTLKRGEVVQCTMSDIGFIAVAFASKSLAVLDMRGPDVILREGFDEDGEAWKRKKRKNQNVQNVPGELSIVGAMKWTVSGMGADAIPRPRLIVSYAKGMTKIYSLQNVLGEWMVESKPPTFTNESLAAPLASFVLDSLNGNELLASAEALSGAMNIKEAAGKNKDVPPHCLWVAASKRSIRIAVNFNGERVSKVELEPEEALSEVLYVTRHGQRVLVAVTEKGTAMFYSMPFLQYITRMDLYFGTTGRKMGKMSIDDRSGDFVEFSGPLDINLRTFFHFRKPLPPRIDPCTLKRVVPSQPMPLNSVGYVGSWIWGGAPLTGAQLDVIVGGPKRPPLPKELAPPKKPLVSWGKAADEPVKSTSTPAAALPKRTAVRKQKGPTRDAREREDVYAEMSNAAEERGSMLDGLADSLGNVSVSATSYLSQARNAAIKEAAKSTAKGMFGKLL